jgi:hypothetical protein
MAIVGATGRRAMTEVAMGNGCSRTKIGWALQVRFLLGKILKLKLMAKYTDLIDLMLVWLNIHPALRNTCTHSYSFIKILIHILYINIYKFLYLRVQYMLYTPTPPRPTSFNPAEKLVKPAGKDGSDWRVKYTLV